MIKCYPNKISWILGGCAVLAPQISESSNLPNNNQEKFWRNLKANMKVKNLCYLPKHEKMLIQLQI